MTGTGTDAGLDRIRGLLVHGASLLTSWPQTPVWRETLSKLDFMVCIDRQMTADAAYADVVLPATTMFEIQSYMTYGPLLRLRERLVEPVGEARNDYLILSPVEDASSSVSVSAWGVQLQLDDADAPGCILLPKGAPCTNDGECCSGKCRGPAGNKTCK